MTSVAKISRCKATFRIGADYATTPYGALPDPAAVTVTLGIKPTHSHSPGDHKSARAAPFKHGQWSLTSPLPQTAELEAHLDWLLTRLLPVQSHVLDVLKQDERLRADFFCGLWIASWNEGLTVSAGALAGIASLRAELGFDIYWMGDDDVDPSTPAESIT